MKTSRGNYLGINLWRSKGIGAIFFSILTLNLGCTILREAIGLGPQRPKVALVDIEATNASFTTVELLAHLRVDNPNSFELEFHSLSYQLKVEDTLLATGAYGPAIKIPEESHIIVRLPLKIDALSAAQLIKDFLSGKMRDLLFGFKASAVFESPFGPIDVDFHDQKSLKSFGFK